MIAKLVAAGHRSITLDFVEPNFKQFFKALRSTINTQGQCVNHYTANDDAIDMTLSDIEADIIALPLSEQDELLEEYLEN